MFVFHIAGMKRDWKMYILQHTNIMEVVYNGTPNRGQWCKRVNQGNNKCNNCMKGSIGVKVIAMGSKVTSSNMIQGHCNNMKKDEIDRHGQGHKGFFCLR
jgi:hypothetical protein